MFKLYPYPRPPACSRNKSIKQLAGKLPQNGGGGQGGMGDRKIAHTEYKIRYMRYLLKKPPDDQHDANQDEGNTDNQPYHGSADYDSNDHQHKA